MNNLCKWDNSILTYRKRKLPSGKPKEYIYEHKKGDPTWSLEHDYLFNINKKNKTNYKNDIKIKKYIDNLFNE